MFPSGLSVGGIDGSEATGVNVTEELVGADGATGATAVTGATLCVDGTMTKGLLAGGTASGLLEGQSTSMLAHEKLPPMQVQVVVFTQFPEGQQTSS